MRIKIVSIYFIPADPRPKEWCARKAFIFVRLETDEGLIGWGEAYTLAHRERSTVALIDQLGQRLIGTDPADIKAFTTAAYRIFGEWRAGIDFFCAVSALEIAMWDLVGKSLSTPVYRLLGGVCRQSVPFYANIWTNRAVTAAELAAKAETAIAEGFRAIKFYPFIAGESFSEGVEKVRRVRQAVGPEISLIVDLWRRTTPAQARRIARLIEPFDLALIEEPMAPDNLRVLKNLHAQIQQPLMVGETLATKRDYLPLFESGAVDFINPDVGVCGGILEMREIAAMAESFFIQVSPHNYNSMSVALAATLHAAAGIPNLYLSEYFPEFAPESQALCRRPISIMDGNIELPSDPGLGVELDEMELLPYRIMLTPQD